MSVCNSRKEQEKEQKSSSTLNANKICGKVEKKVYHELIDHAHQEHN